jgi:transposase
MKTIIEGIKGKDFIIEENDKLTMKIAMLIEGHCTIGVKAAIDKYGYTEASYYQILDRYMKGGSQELINKKPGSTKRKVRVKEVENQIIRLRFLDPFSGADVITQKLNQMGYNVSKRSVERTITDYGLQKKHMF